MNAIVSEAELAQAQAQTGWTDIRLNVARQMFNAGKSASQIAVALGSTTRNAVIGALHRHGTKRGIQPRAYVRPRPRIATPPRTRSTRALATSAEPAAQVMPVDDAAIPFAQRRSLIDLDGGCCHWPVGDPSQPGFFFCGAIAREGEPYCPAHMRRATEPRRPRPYKSKVTAAHVNNAWFR